MTSPAAVRLRQPWLFQMPGPLTAVLGTELFVNIPRRPGVYFFYGAADRLLYIGQSHDLRARIGSYRFVSEERHARRTVRLVSSIRRVDWRLCESAAEAIALEGTLLLEHKPPFNRAGVWQSPGLWLTLDVTETRWQSVLTREEPENGCGIGPLPAAFRYVHPALLRCIYRLLHPAAAWWELPAGLSGNLVPPAQSWEVSGGAVAAAEALRRLILTGASDLLDALTAADGGASAAEAFRIEDVEAVREFFVKLHRRSARSAA